MIIESHSSLSRPEKKEVTRLVVYDNFGNAIAVFMQIDSRNIDIQVKGQPGFEEALGFLGIKQTVVVDVIKKDGLPQLVF